MDAQRVTAFAPPLDLSEPFFLFNARSASAILRQLIVRSALPTSVVLQVTAAT